jgi:hypothetical protein
LRTIQAFRGEVIEVGCFRFNEIYREKSKLELHSDGLEMDNNSSEKLKLLVVGTGPGNFDHEMVKIVLKTMQDNLTSDFDITYRPHPFRVSKSDMVQPLLELKNLKLDIAAKDERNSHRLQIIMESDVVVSLYSTVLLEATILNKPCIIPAFITGPKGYNTGNFLDDLSHYSGVSSLGTIHVANSTTEFLEILRKLELIKGSIHTSEKILNWYCKNTDTANDICEIINKVIAEFTSS